MIHTKTFCDLLIESVITAMPIVLLLTWVSGQTRVQISFFTLMEMKNTVFKLPTINIRLLSIY